MRSLLQDGAAPDLVAAVPRLHLLLVLAHHPHPLLPRRADLNVGVRTSARSLRRLRHLHEVERPVRAIRQEAPQQEQGDPGSKH